MAYRPDIIQEGIAILRYLVKTEQNETARKELNKAVTLLKSMGIKQVAYSQIKELIGRNF